MVMGTYAQNPEHLSGLVRRIIYQVSHPAFSHVPARPQSDLSLSATSSSVATDVCTPTCHQRPGVRMCSNAVYLHPIHAWNTEVHMELQMVMSSRCLRPICYCEKREARWSRSVLRSAVDSACRLAKDRDVRVRAAQSCLLRSLRKKRNPSYDCHKDEQESSAKLLRYEQFVASDSQASIAH